MLLVLLSNSFLVSLILLEIYIVTIVAVVHSHLVLYILVFAAIEASLGLILLMNRKRSDCYSNLRFFLLTKYF